jgi:branched-subunit amino acid transport protein
MTMLVTMLLVGLGSYLFRVVPLLLVDRVRLSTSVERLMGHAVLAALSALVGSMLVQLTRNPVPEVPVAALWIGLTAGAVAALLRQSMGRVAVIGMAAYLAVTLAGATS